MLFLWWHGCHHGPLWILQGGGLGRYPLHDLNPDCGSIMYGRICRQRRDYTCGRYMSTGGAECEHNSVDAESLLNFTLATLTELVDGLGSVGLRMGLRFVEAITVP
jgi:hypothetical protein